MLSLSNRLPTFDENAERQRQSVHALFEKTRRASLLVRGEQYMDYGVDATLEVVVGAQVTNYTAQIQLKAVETFELNADGSISKPIEVSNFNYLLNGQCPIYLLYSVQQHRFRFVWAYDEYRRLEKANPTWRNQGTITLRFSAELDDAALQEIRHRIIHESKFRRDLAGWLARLSLSEPAKISIEPRTLATETPDTAYAAILHFGHALVSGGRWRDVLDKFALLSELQRREPQVCVVMSYANYAQGRYLNALGFCGEAYLRAQELSLSDRDMLEVIRDSCECLIGRISRQDYTRRQILASQSSGASTQRSLEAIRFQLLAEHDESRRQTLLTEFRRQTSEVLADPQSSEGFKLQTEVHLAYIEGWQCQLAVSKTLGQLSVQRSIGWVTPRAAPAAEAISAMAQWDLRMQQLVRQAEYLAIPWLQAEARRTALIIRTASLGFCRFQHKYLQSGEPPSHTEIKSLLADADATAALFAEAGNIEGEMRARIAAAEIYELIDDVESAKKIAADVKVVAQALFLDEVSTLAEKILSGSTILQENERSIEKRRVEGPDPETAAMSDADIDYFATAMLTASELPEERLPMVRRDVVAMRDIARERQNWCRHLTQIQNLYHTQHRSTAYAIDPERFCKCLKHGFESLRGSPDADLVTKHFKSVYCEGCTDRTPQHVAATPK